MRVGEGGEASAYERARASLLSPESVQGVLDSIVQGDPLRMFERAEEAIGARCIWVSPFRVCDESVFSAIAMAPTLSRDDDFEAWLQERVEDAIDNLLRRDWEALIGGEITDDMVAESAMYLAGWLECEPGAALRVAIRFNNLPAVVRRTHFAVFVDGKSVAECLEAGLGPPETLANNIELSSRLILAEVAAFRTEASGEGSDGGVP